MSRRRRVIAVHLLALLAVFGSPGAARADGPTPTGEIVPLTYGSEGTYIDAAGKRLPVIQAYVRTESGSDSSAVYTFTPGSLVIGSKYEMSTPDAVRAGPFPAVHWLATKHGTTGKALGYWPETEAVQLCIWNQHDPSVLTAARVPDHAVYARAQELCAAVKRVDPSKDSPYPTVHRRIELLAYVRRSTAKSVTVETRLADLDNNSGLNGQPLDASYDELEQHPKTGNGGTVQLRFPRRDDTVVFDVHYRGDYDQGLPWMSVDGSSAPVVAADKLPVEFNEEIRIEPAQLTGGIGLAYQELGDFLARHTPLPAQPAAAIGLAVLLAGWVITLVGGLVKLVRWKKER